MKTKIDFLIMTCLLAVSAFLFTGCYTQLAKSEPEATPAPYYVEEAVEEEYGEDSEIYEEQQMYDEEVYDDEDDEDIRKYYYDVNYSVRPWAYDPFFDPYFYDEYTPYSTHVSVSVNYYDPWYVEPWWCIAGSFPRWFHLPEWTRRLRESERWVSVVAVCGVPAGSGEYFQH